MNDRRRCEWCGDDPLYRRYHDREWGAPGRGERKLFELLCLEGAQAGLSWITILRKRARYVEVFDGFDPEKIARYGPGKIARLLADPGIVRNRLKVNGFIKNARACLEMRDGGRTLDKWLWDFVDGEPIQNNWRSMDEIPATTPLSDAISRELKKRGFTFVGPTIVYAFMQAAGMVNDHLVHCFRHRELSPQKTKPPVREKKP